MRFEPARVEHAAQLLQDIRPLDLQEVEASTGDPGTTVEMSVRLSHNPWVVFSDDDRLLCLFGAAPYNLLDNKASPWLLGTTHLGRYSKTLTRVAQAYIAEIREQFPRLENYVDARNTPSIRWLKRVGFAVDPPRVYGVQRRMFHRFHMGLEDV